MPPSATVPPVLVAITGESLIAVTVILNVPVAAVALFSPPSARLNAMLSLVVSEASCTYCTIPASTSACVNEAILTPAALLSSRRPLDEAVVTL